MYDDDDDDVMDYEDEESSQDYRNWLWATYDDEGEWYGVDIDPYA